MINEYQTNALNLAFGYPGDRLRTISAASQLFRTIRYRGLARRVRSALTGHPYRLLDLEAIRATCDVRDRHYAGIRTVPIRQIRGSEGRCEDFDAEFRPLRTHSRERWSHIAIAQQMGKTMPPVKLIQIGDMYFVRDGHHRISVARALGQKEIDAEVVVWRVTGPLPWEWQVLPEAPVSEPVCQVACAREKCLRHVPC